MVLRATLANTIVGALNTMSLLAATGCTHRAERGIDVPS
jgi:hypothetical protein